MARLREKDRALQQEVGGDLAVELEVAKLQVERQTNVKQRAVQRMIQILQFRKNAIKRRCDFERWRCEIAKEAANASFSEKAGRLRKCYAVEKLVGGSFVRLSVSWIRRGKIRIVR